MSIHNIIDFSERLVQLRVQNEQPPVADTRPPEPAVELPRGTQAEDVRAAVDTMIGQDATVEQRNTAYSEVQAYVERVAQGGDYEVIGAESMQSIALHVMRQESVPTAYRQEVLDAVDREISRSATTEQRMEAYASIQRYVDAVGIGEAGILPEALPARVSTLLDEDGIPTVAADARAEAERILEVGVNTSRIPFHDPKDDYGARMDAFVDAISGQPEAFQAHLIAELLAQDPGALNSWLTVGRTVEHHEAGGLDDATFATIVENIAEAYNTGAIDADSFRELYDIDYGPTQAREYAQLLSFLAGSDGEQTAALRADLAEKIFAEWSVSPYPTDMGFHGYNFRQFSLAIEMAAGDPSRPEILTEFLASREQGELDRIFAIAGQLPQAQPDLMATIFGTVARDDSSQAAALAATLARLPGENSSWFEQGQVSRNEALADMLAAHSDAVLGALSEYEDRGARGLGADTNLKQYEVNGRDLAAVLELTVFNPEIDDASRQAARAEILEYVTEQAQIIDDSREHPNSEGYEDASGRIVVLGAATDVAVDRGFEALTADREAQKEAIAFAVDLALAAVPLSSRLSAATSGRISELFADNPLVRDALNGLSGQVINRTTGQLTDVAKEQLYANLDSDPELAALFERETIADTFRENILGAVADERDRADIRRDANGLADDISNMS